MEIKRINIKEVTEIYNKYIINDFPDNERRPLDKIINLINQKQYIPYALFKNNIVIGYAFFYGLDNRYICDYFAIVDEYRQQNYGSYFLKECLHLFKDKTLYFEVEKPEEPDKEIKEKRIQFYLKNGLITTNVEMILYYVDYIILANKNSNTDEVEKLYKDLYDSYFYQKYISFKKEK